MRIFLAAQYPRRDELREHAKRLRELGVFVTSRWLVESAPLDGNMGDEQDGYYRAAALIDLADIDKSEAVIFFSEDPLVGVVCGGRHVEFGYAVALNKAVYVIGPKENVYHHLHGVKHYDSLDELIEKENLKWE